MLRLLIFAFLVLTALSVIATVVALIVSVIVFVATALAIGIPIYLVAKHFFGDTKPLPNRQTAIERLKTMYIDGKIDLFEFERRVARLIAVEN